MIPALEALVTQVSVLDPRWKESQLLVMPGWIGEGVATALMAAAAVRVVGVPSRGMCAAAEASEERRVRRVMYVRYMVDILVVLNVLRGERLFLRMREESGW